MVLTVIFANKFIFIYSSDYRSVRFMSGCRAITNIRPIKFVTVTLMIHNTRSVDLKNYARQDRLRLSE